MSTHRIQRLMYLDPDRFELLERLAADKRTPMAALVREAINDLLMKHGKLRRPRRDT